MDYTSSKYGLEDIIQIKLKLRQTLTNERFIHSVGVSEVAAELAAIHGEDAVKAEIAGLLHDCAKDIPNDVKIMRCKKYRIKIDKVMAKQPGLLHSFLGAEIAKREYKISDKDILNAIAHHTTGRRNMSGLEKIIYLADFIEPNRKPFKSSQKIKTLTYENLNRALVFTLKESMKYVKEKRLELHKHTIEAFEYYCRLT